ncbi:histidine phosphatase family protein [Nannocystis bainbridge]|uniref:Histidine phosphatase family protein n=1 Tax=Nannocystis bainbridge TaxID=2995303 RepID=A0ABT5E1D3_9BACT|nr:histidine phosphatase family protein [Nannocystis bainbridge]MDC0719682.1 histidine phosphatase family protein [Nannocystis bainbridge]
MSRLLIIRHGQASLGAADYDVLSPLGEQQASALGRYLAGMIDPPQAIYAGPRKRQRDTAALLVAGAQQAGAEFPAPSELLEFDEYPAIALMKDAMPALCEADPELAALATAWMGAERGSPGHQRAFELVFQAAMRRWHEGRVEHPAVEPFAAFQGRVARGLERVMQQHPRRSTVLVVSSAGPVGVVTALALGLDTWAGLKTSFIVHNASLTELAYRPGEMQLRVFNALPHIHERAHVTLR